MKSSRYAILVIGVCLVLSGCGREDFKADSGKLEKNTEVLISPDSHFWTNLKNRTGRFEVANFDDSKFYTLVSCNGDPSVISQSQLAKRASTKLVREKSIEDVQVIYECSGIEEFTYLTESEGSSHFAYFTKADMNGVTSLYVYDFATESFECLVPEPCSNMIEISEGDLELGWILHDNSILAVDLANGSVCDSLSRNFSHFNFFFDSNSQYSVRIPGISLIDDTSMEVEISYFPSKFSRYPQGKEYYLYRWKDGELYGPFDSPRM